MRACDILPVLGQSNASGQGIGPYFATLEGQDIRIRQLGRFNADDMQVIRVGQTAGHYYWDGLQHWKKSTAVYMSPTLPFARNYAKYVLEHARGLLVVPCAFGGTSIEEWLGTDAQPVGVPDGVTMWSDAQTRIQHCLDLNPANKIIATFWHQGENNFNSDPADYQGKLTQMWGTIRTAFPGSWPMMTAGYCPPLATNAQAIQAAVASVVVADPKAFMVSTDDMQSNDAMLGNGDLLHFCADSAVTIGERLFTAYMAHR